MDKRARLETISPIDQTTALLSFCVNLVVDLLTLWINRKREEDMGTSIAHLINE